MTDLIAVTGATGWIGREVCRWLEDHGHGVRRVTRDGAAPGGMALDLTSDAGAPEWSEALRGCTALIHCAALVHRPLETKEDRALFEEVNVAGLKKLLYACSVAGISKIVLASSSSVYDWSLGTAMSETATIRPTTVYGASKLQAENLVQASGLDWRIARLATVYGVGDRANFRLLAHALKNRRFLIPGRGDAKKSILSAGRAGEILGRLALDNTSSKAMLNVASPSVPTLREICAAYCQICGFAKAPSVPVWLLRNAARIGDLSRALGLPTPLTSHSFHKLTTSTVLDVSKMQQMFPDLCWPNFSEDLARAADYYASV